MEASYTSPPKAPLELEEGTVDGHQQSWVLAMDTLGLSERRRRVKGLGGEEQETIILKVRKNRKPRETIIIHLDCPEP